MDSCVQSKGVDRGTEGPTATAGAQELCVRLSGELSKPIVQHAREQAADDGPTIVANGVEGFRRPLMKDLDGRRGHLGVGHNADQIFGVKRYRVVRQRSCGRSVAQGTKRLTNVGFHVLRLHVSDDDHSNPFGAVPRVVEVAQALDWGVTDDLGFADGRAIRIARLVEQHRRLGIANPGRRAEATTPFLDDDAALFVDFFLAERQAAGKIGKRLNPLCHNLLRIGGKVEHVDRLVKARVGVDVRAKPRADRLEVRHEFARLEVRAPVEGHVFDQVRQALLIVGFVE